MNQLKTTLVAMAAGALACAAMAQDTNSLYTQIGRFEARTDVVVFKAVGQVGSVALGSAQLSVRCKQTTDVSTGEKIHGLAIEIEGNQLPGERTLVDDDEVDSLLNAINYLGKLNYDVTSLPSFEATYTTKAGLSVIANSVRKDGTVLTYLQLEDGPRIAVSSVQMAQLSDLIEESRKSLAALKAGK